MKFYIITLGCKVNTYESEYIKSSLLNEQYCETEEISDADIIIINTCSVTNQADNKSAKMIRHARRENNHAILVVCGCSAEYKRDQYNDLGIDILIGTREKNNIVILIKNFINTKEKYISFHDEMSFPFESMQIEHFSERTRAFIKIQDGCNNYCSYCVIPYLRKNLRSKDFLETIKEIENLVNNGYQEIVLTGIHTGSYGIGTEHDLTDLIHEISKLEKLKRIRISSIEITELNDKFINELKVNNKICDHLHIPLQAGSNEVLKLMNRKYDLNYFFDKLKELKIARPNINFTTDIIVGFPSETDELFNKTLESANLCGFSKIHVFPYSVREKTVASKLPKKVDEPTKKCRTKKLICLSDELELKYNKGNIGKTVNVLIETTGDYSIGHTSDYLKVRVNDKLIHNQFYDVKIISATNEYCEGVVITKGE